MLKAMYKGIKHIVNMRNQMIADTAAYALATVDQRQRKRS